MEKKIILSERIINRIYLVRSLKVMLDRDMGELYSVETRILKQAVRRNINRFPDDFMFELSDEEMQDWPERSIGFKFKAD